MTGLADPSTASRDPAARAPSGRPVRMAVVGMSTSATCGVRDYALGLADALGGENVSCSMHWLDRREQALAATRAEVSSWTRGLAGELERLQPDAVLLHYSVFSLAYRGLPLFVGPTLAVLRGRAPLLTVMHEFAYPWGRAGLRGTAWAVSQRAVLIEVMRASTAALVTIDARAEWLGSRVWLPRRPVAFAPVFSNLPPPSAGLPADPQPGRLGLFGYSHEGSAVALVLDALGVLRDRGRTVELTLLGAPGRDSPVGQVWLEGARTRGLEAVLSFSGQLGAQELSNALAACELLLFADSAGPSSRKTTLAASLASGRAVVAIDGPLRWSELSDAQAVELVAPSAHALADGVSALLGDERRRDAQAERGRAFAERQMSVARGARAVAALLERTLTR
jgi:glycosyltransferase involved in cell wall biosynthesis